jgi:hypothetical protein
MRNSRPDRLSWVAPPTGRDLGGDHYCTRNNGFNPRARTGRDLGGDHYCTRNNGFNPRARTGRDQESARH